jgi:uncharacterized protein involved in exopolysaccharide biosynthesis
MQGSSHARPVGSNNTALDLSDLIRIVRTHVRWWAIPAVVCAVLAAVYSVVAPRHWQATQALIIRPEAAGVSDQRLGKFADLSEMKTLQETILELAKSQSVIQATLLEVGPPGNRRRPAHWPTPLDIEQFRKCVDMRPPGGAEFGTTEVFYLSVRDTNRQRAGALVGALCIQLVERAQEIRDLRAHGMVVELERTVAMAEQDLTKRTEQLSAFEGNIGADLAELRNLNAEIGGQGEVSQELQAIETERRANDSLRRANERLLKLLISAQDDPQQLLATPNSLLQSQPAVAQLKQALVAAEVRTAGLLGSRSEKHPFVLAAREAEQLLREQLHDEVAVAIRALEVDIELNVEREQSLSARCTAARDRLARLAESRASYAKLVASVENHTRLVETARRNLADARARQAGARSASVISRIDDVDAGVHPVGLARKTITAAGGVSGLLLGVGCVFLFATPGSPSRTVVVSPSQPNAYATVNSRASSTATSVPPAPVYAQANSVSFTNSKSSCKAHGTENAFGIFHGMTLEEAIRSVKHQSTRRI